MINFRTIYTVVQQYGSIISSASDNEEIGLEIAFHTWEIGCHTYSRETNSPRYSIIQYSGENDSPGFHTSGDFEKFEQLGDRKYFSLLFSGQNRFD